MATRSSHSTSDPPATVATVTDLRRLTCGDGNYHACPVPVPITPDSRRRRRRRQPRRRSHQRYSSSERPLAEGSELASSVGRTRWFRRVRIDHFRGFWVHRLGGFGFRCRDRGRMRRRATTVVCHAGSSTRFRSVGGLSHEPIVRSSKFSTMATSVRKPGPVRTTLQGRKLSSVYVPGHPAKSHNSQAPSPSGRVDGYFSTGLVIW